MYFLGIQLLPSPHGLKIQRARFSYSKKTPFLQDLQEEDLPSFITYLSQKEEKIISSGLNSSEVLLRELTLPSHEKKKILALLPFQVEPILPYKIEEALISTKITNIPSQKQSLIDFFITKKVSVINHIDLYEKMGIGLDDVFCVPSALCQFIQFFFPTTEKILVIHIEAEAVTTTKIEKGRITSCHNFSINPHTEPSLLEKNWHRIFSILEQKEDFPPELIITGNGSYHMIDYIKKACPTSCQITSTKAYGSYDSQTLQSFAVPIGLALEGIPEKKSFSFLFKDLPSPLWQKKRKTKILRFTGAATAFFCLMLLLGTLHVSQKKIRLLNGFSTITSKEKSHLPSLNHLEKELVTLEIEEKKKQKGYALNVPFATPSKLFTHISTHSAFTQIEGIEILKVDYILENYPSATSPQSPYAGKVQIKLLIPKESTASLFYERFRQNNPFILKNTHPVWEQEPPYYRLSFSLAQNSGELP